MSGLEQRDHAGCHGELQRHVGRVAETDLEPGAEPERQGLGRRRDRADPPGEPRAGERGDGRHRDPKLAHREGSGSELDVTLDPDPGEPGPIPTIDGSDDAAAPAPGDTNRRPAARRQPVVRARSRREGCGGTRGRSVHLRPSVATPPPAPRRRGRPSAGSSRVSAQVPSGPGSPRVVRRRRPRSRERRTHRFPGHRTRLQRRRRRSGLRGPASGQTGRVAPDPVAHPRPAAGAARRRSPRARANAVRARVVPRWSHVGVRGSPARSYRGVTVSVSRRRSRRGARPRAPARRRRPRARGDVLRPSMRDSRRLSRRRRSR